MIISEINKYYYIYLSSISEPEGQLLKIVITGVNRSDLGEGSGQNLKSYELIFDNYISYCVRDESYANLESNEGLEGNLGSCSESSFLNYIKDSTFAADLMLEPITHYDIICIDHIIDIASFDEPKITELKNHAED